MGGSNWLYLTRDDLDAYLAQRPDASRKLIPPEATAAIQQRKRFDWMEAEEEMVFLDRRHWYFLASRLTLAVLFSLVAIGLILAGSGPGTGLILRLLGAIILIPSAFAVLWIVIDWFNDYYIVTDRRAVHQEKLVLIRQTRDEAPLNRIQNVNILRLFVGNLLGFGTLLINTAAAFEARRVVFTFLSNPEKVQAILLAQMEKARVGALPETRRSIRQSLGESVGPALYPEVPRPVISPDSLPSPAAPQPRIWTQVYRATLGELFWIEQHTDGQVTWRKHWIRLLAKTWAPLLTLVVLVAVSSLLLTVIPGEPLALNLLFLALILPALGWLWWQWVDWGNDRYIVTGDRIIDTDRLPLGFRSQRTEATFDRIQNVSFEIPNPIATLLNYGTVEIYTAGAEGRLDFLYVRDPSGVQSEIFRRIAAFEQARLQEQRVEKSAELPQWFSVYDETYHT
jgi:membrane protein YdbS with pleckstrin-like domain